MDGGEQQQENPTQDAVWTALTIALWIVVAVLVIAVVQSAWV